MFHEIIRTAVCVGFMYVCACMSVRVCVYVLRRMLLKNLL